MNYYYEVIIIKLIAIFLSDELWLCVWVFMCESTLIVLCTNYYLNVFSPPFVVLRMCSSGVQTIRYLGMSLIYRMLLCLFSFLLIEFIVRVALICNTRETRHSFTCLSYVVYFFFICILNHFSNLLLLRLFMPTIL